MKLWRTPARRQTENFEIFFDGRPDSIVVSTEGQLSTASVQLTANYQYEPKGGLRMYDYALVLSNDDLRLIIEELNSKGLLKAQEGKVVYSPSNSSKS